MLARYTWVVLRRLSGSSKKFKGNIVVGVHNIGSQSSSYLLSLVTKSAFSDGPYDFHETSTGHRASLQIPRLVRNGEQAIDTIHLIGEQPDVVTNSLLQNFVLRVLGKKQLAPAEDGTIPDGDVQP
ncbi:hypothetical protein FRC02_002581 [Tulasnella sp. 418]|nr:hypothetical protein FRC02_002581 [Tulasnella sp. 418]